MIALTHAIEALRVANYVDRTEHYRWTVFSIDGNPVEASNGIAMRPTQALDVWGPLPDVMIVCGGARIREMVDARSRHALSALAKRRIVMGSLIVALGLGFYLIGGTVAPTPWIAVVFTFFVCVNLSYLSGWKIGGPLALTLVMI